MSTLSEMFIDEDEPITNVVGYLQYMFRSKAKKAIVKCYRGQGDFDWSVAPSVLRGLKTNAENNLLLELFSEVPEEFSTDKFMFDKLVRAQHYSLPTRLVDVSLNPLVALYFACKNKEQYHNDGCVLTYSFPEERVKFADSDVVSLICNLARLSAVEKSNIIQRHRRLKEQVSDGLITSAQAADRFRATKEINRLIHFVREEKPYFTNNILPHDLFRYFLVHPKKNNKRVVAQSGLFIAAGLLQYRKLEDSIVVNKLKIPAESKLIILDELNQLNINEKSMFPEVEKVSIYIKSKWEK